jgi:glucose/arabinose dehydrogenase
VKHLWTLAATALALVAATLTPSSTATAQAPPEGIAIPLIALDQVADLDDAIAMTTRAGTDDLYVAEREGIVRRLVPDGDDYDVSPTPVADISAQTVAEGERGLLGLAFSPTGNRLFLHFTNNGGNTRIVEYRMNGGGTGNRVVASSQRRVLALHQPFANHNGGTITYGPDNRLYVALGDGGDGGDPMNNAQNLRVLLGKVLRINPNPGPQTNFSAPANNPFVGQAPRRKAIWLYGVRNPWRISFDMETGDLWVGDVGQNAVEEIDFLPADGNGLNAGRADNLGWRRMEGNDPYEGRTAPNNHTPPVFDYDHFAGRCTVIGGHVYRGANPDYDGTYFFGDFCTGELGYVQVNGSGDLQSSAIDIGDDVPAFTLQSFGQDNDGEVYVLTSNGLVYRIVEAV